MYFDRRDVRGVVIVLAVVALVVAIGFLIRTWDLPAGVTVARKKLQVPQEGDPAYMYPFWISLGVSAVLAMIAGTKRLWER